MIDYKQYRLTVISEPFALTVGKRMRKCVMVRCECGREWRVQLDRLLRKDKPLQSCGKCGMRRKETTKSYRWICAFGHPYAGENGRILEHRKVLFDKIGDGFHPCHWCNEPVEWGKGRPKKGLLVADHIDGNIHNNNPDNLVPACHRCNCTRSRDDIITAGELYRQNGDHIARAVERICHTCDKPFLFIPSQQSDRKPNAGKYCSPRCLWDRQQ